MNNTSSNISGQFKPGFSCLEASCFNRSQIIAEKENVNEIAIAGRSNVGKSSLINALLNTKLAKTGSTPGKTRSINFYNVEFFAPQKQKKFFRLVDLPGYGYAARSKSERNEWQNLISSYMRNRTNLKLVCHLVDFRHGLLNNDRELQEWLKSQGKNIFVVFTKADKISRGKWRKTLMQYVKDGLYSTDVPIITSTAPGELKNSGIDELRNLIANFI